jgi:hypothetical protein
MSSSTSHRRGLGPFSGGQLTAIIITLLIVAGFPFAASAVTGSNSFITDATTGARAKVDSKNNLYTATRDATSGTPAKVNSAGQQLVASDTTAIYNSGLRLADDCASGTCVTLAKPPIFKALVITSIHVDVEKVNSPGGVSSFVSIGRSSDGTCQLGAVQAGQTVEVVEPPSVGTTVLSFDAPGGLVLPAGRALCLFMADSTNRMELSAFGYAVAPGSVPSNPG